MRARDRQREQPPGPHGTGLAGADAIFDAFALEDDSIALAGWMLNPDIPIERARLVVNGVPVGEAAITRREDVGRHFPRVPHAAQSGVAISGAIARRAGPLHIELIGSAGGRDRAVHEQYRPTGPDPARPLPPPHLMTRVAGSDDADMFRAYGLTIAAQLLRQVRAHLPDTPAPRLLDWGCGVGRATGHVFDLWPQAVVTGCDLDAEAIDWARAHLPGGRFHVTQPHPPLPFTDAAFDAVVASSVMTHLTAPLQQVWLREIRRVLRPGGVFVASVLGPFAARGLATVTAASLREAGVIDIGADTALDGIAPDAFYRDTLQSIEHTYAAWSEEMSILTYREAGLVNHQDLVVLRREPETAGWLHRLWR